MPTSDPSLSVVILSYNRAETLRLTLASVRRQDSEGFEAILVDNASSDDSVDMVKREFPEVRIVQMPSNLGILARNVGFCEARGEIVLSLDNDIELIESGALRRIVRRFETRPKLGALTLQIREADTGEEHAAHHWWHPRARERFQREEFETDHISEAAVAFRARALRETGGYYERLFWGGEEWDLSLALMDAGYEIRYLPEPVQHLAPRGNLNYRSDPRHALLVRNRSWIALRRLPLSAALWFAVPRLAGWGLRALRFGYLAHYLRGLGGLLAAAPSIVRDRKRISAETYRRVLELRGYRHAWDWIRSGASTRGER